MAEALAEVIDPFERFDRMLGSTEDRRNNALSQIDQHRKALGAAIRRAVDEVQNTESRVLETGEMGGGSPP